MGNNVKNKNTCCRREFDDGNDGEAKRPRWTGRVGREPELSLFTDPKFRYWNLPAKAKFLLVSNLPKVQLVFLCEIRNMNLDFFLQI